MRSGGGLGLSDKRTHGVQLLGSGFARYLAHRGRLYQPKPLRVFDPRSGSRLRASAPVHYYRLSSGSHRLPTPTDYHRHRLLAGRCKLGQRPRFTLPHDAAIGIAQIALAFGIGPAGSRRFGFMTTPVIVLPVLLLLFILGYFGGKLLPVPFFQLLPCGCELGFKLLAFCDLCWQPGRIYFPLAIRSLRFALNLLYLLFQLLNELPSAVISDPPPFILFVFHPAGTALAVAPPQHL